MRWFAIAAIVAGVFCAPGHAAEMDLAGTDWDATNDCNFDGMGFSPGGVVDIYDTAHNDHDTASWTLDGNKLSVKFETWYGGFEGYVRADGQEIMGEETWLSVKSGKVEHATCTFGPHKG